MMGDMLRYQLSKGFSSFRDWFFERKFSSSFYDCAEIRELGNAQEFNMRPVGVRHTLGGPHRQASEREFLIFNYSLA
jgi:hypothetical protein